MSAGAAPNSVYTLGEGKAFSHWLETPLNVPPPEIVESSQGEDTCPSEQHPEHSLNPTKHAQISLPVLSQKLPFYLVFFCFVFQVKRGEFTFWKVIFPQLNFIVSQREQVGKNPAWEWGDWTLCPSRVLVCCTATVTLDFHRGLELRNCLSPRRNHCNCPSDVTHPYTDSCCSWNREYRDAIILLQPMTKCDHSHLRPGVQAGLVFMYRTVPQIPYSLSPL